MRCGRSNAGPASGVNPLIEESGRTRQEIATTTVYGLAMLW
jgi:hypothetical protein